MKVNIDQELCAVVKETVGEISFDPKSFTSYQKFPKSPYLRPYLAREIERLDITFDIDEIRRITYDILLNYGLKLKDGTSTYGGISLQFSEWDNDVLFGSVENFKFKRRSQDYSHLNELGERFKFIYDAFKNVGVHLSRGRILGAKPGMKIPSHKDYDYRIHIPVWTNDGCFAIFGNNEYHMPADGGAYLHNGFYEHSARNDGDQDRIHLIFVISPL